MHSDTLGDVDCTQGKMTPILAVVVVEKRAMGRVHGTMEQRKGPVPAVWGHTPTDRA